MVGCSSSAGVPRTNAAWRRRGRAAFSMPVTAIQGFRTRDFGDTIKDPTRAEVKNAKSTVKPKGERNEAWVTVLLPPLSSCRPERHTIPHCEVVEHLMKTVALNATAYEFFVRDPHHCSSDLPASSGPIGSLNVPPASKTTSICCGNKKSIPPTFSPVVFVALSQNKS